MRAVWTNRRFSWPFVIVVAFLTLSIAALDYAWRNVVLPFETLLIYAAAADILVAALLMGFYFLLRRRRERQPS